jgi:hypothetical protein
MYEQNNSRWGRTRGQVGWTARLLFALIGGVVFALVAWEPPTAKSIDASDAQSAALPIGSTAVKEDSVGPQLDSLGIVREFDAVFGWTLKRDKSSKQDGLDDGAPSSETVSTTAHTKTDQDNRVDSSAIVNPHSRSPPQ